MTCGETLMYKYCMLFNSNTKYLQNMHMYLHTHTLTPTMVCTHSTQLTQELEYSLTITRLLLPLAVC